MIESVIFDMDGLLIDSEPLWQEALAKVFADMDIHLDKEAYERTTGLQTREVVEYWYEQLQWEGKTVDEVSQHILAEVTRRILQDGKLMEGVPYILDFFKDKNYKMGLASSSPMELIDRVLSHYGLIDYFATLHSGEHHEFGKPHPAVYISCAEELNTKPMDCLVFEDSINGLIAAKAARMKVVVVPEKRNSADPRYVLADLKLSSLNEFKDSDLRSLKNV